MTWWRNPLKALDGPPRGDFEQIIQDRLKPVFEAARKRAFAALSRGDEFDEEEERAALIALFLPVLTDAVIFAVNDLEGQFTLGFEIDDVQAQAREWAQQKAEVLADQLLTTTRGLLDGITPEETESALERAFGASRRENIGISETTDALSSGALLFQRLADAIGVVVDLIWYTRKDERVCDICRPLHNKGKAVWSVQFPNGPKAHQRCRCGLRAERRFRMWGQA